MLIRTESHVIVKNKNLDNICFLSKNLYNYVNFILRQVYTKNLDQIPEYQHLIKSFKYKDKEYFEIKKFDFITELVKNNQVDYRALPAQTAQQVVFQVYQDWQTYFNFLKIKHKLTCGLNIPKYKNKGGRNAVIFTNQYCTVNKDGYIQLSKKYNLPAIKTKVKKNQLKQVRILPKSSCYIVEVVYTKEKQELDLNENLYLSIDLGINNLATCVNNADQKSFIINGRVVKSINQYYNKKSSK